MTATEPFAGVPPANPALRVPVSRRDWTRLMTDLGIRPNKGLGQHFLFERGLVERMVRQAGVADEDTILESVANTGRLVVVDEAYPRCGFAADIASIVAEKAFRDLKAPIRKVTPPHTPVPFAPELEDAWLPSPEKIAAAVRETVKA